MKIKDLVPIIDDDVYINVYYTDKNGDMHTIEEGYMHDVLDDRLEMEIKSVGTLFDYIPQLMIEVEPPKPKGIVVQINIEIHVKNKEDYDFHYPEKVKAVLENAGYEVCYINNPTSWPEEVYFG